MHRTSSKIDDENSIRPAEINNNIPPASKHKHLPSFLQRTLKITPLVELLGFFKDHRRHFKLHWIAACSLKEDGGLELKNGLTFMFEMELLVAVLFLGITTSIFFQCITPEMIEKSNDNYWSLEFFVVLLGAITVVVSFCFFGFSYMTLIILQPVHESNVLSFVRTEPYQLVMAITNYCLCLLVYASLLLITMYIMQHTQSNLHIMGIIIGTLISLLGVFLLAANNAMNLSLKSGCFSDKAIINNSELIHLTPEETEAILYNRAITNEKHYGHHNILHDPWTFYKEIKGITNDNNNNNDNNSNKDQDNNHDNTDNTKSKVDKRNARSASIIKRGVLGSGV